MALNTKADILAFLEANRQMFAGKTGFQHYAQQLAEVMVFIEKLTAENEQLIAENKARSKADKTKRGFA